MTTIEQASERIADGLVFQSLAQGEVGKSQRNLLRYGSCQLLLALKQPWMRDRIAQVRIADAKG